MGVLCSRIAPLYGWLPSGALTAWRTLRAADWPKNISETQRYEIAIGIAGVIESGTAEHVADALRAFVQHEDGTIGSAEQFLPMARLLTEADASAKAERVDD